MMKAAVNIYDYCAGTTTEEIASRKLVDPITAIVCAAILPLYKKSSKIGISGHQITVQEPFQLNIPGLSWKPSLRWISRDYYCYERDDLEVFKFNTIEVARLYNPPEVEEIGTLFRYALIGIDSAAKAYEKKLASSAITTYKAYISSALRGEISTNENITPLEQKIKNIWSLKEIELINNQIEIALQYKEDNVNCFAEIKRIERTLGRKAEQFSRALKLYKTKASLKKYIEQDDPIFPNTKN